MGQYLQGLLAQRQAMAGTQPATVPGGVPADRYLGDPSQPGWTPGLRTFNADPEPRLPGPWSPPGQPPALGPPPSHMMPLVARGLSVLGQALGGSEASAASMPPGPGPAPTGVPYPTVPSPYAGTSILSQRLDPTTRMLSNQPPSEVAPPPASYPSPAAETYATQAPAEGGVIQGALSPADQKSQQRSWTRGLRTLDGLLRRDSVPGGVPGMGSITDEHLSALDDLVAQGAITVTGDDFDVHTKLPGGDAAKQRLIALVDAWRELAPFRPGGAGGFVMPPSGSPMPVPGGAQTPAYPQAPPQQPSQWLQDLAAQLASGEPKPGSGG